MYGASQGAVVLLAAAVEGHIAVGVRGLETSDADTQVAAAAVAAAAEAAAAAIAWGAAAASAAQLKALVAARQTLEASRPLFCPNPNAETTGAAAGE